MKKMAVVIPLFKEKVEKKQEKNPTMVTTLSGQSIHINKAYPKIKKGEFIGWERI